MRHHSSYLAHNIMTLPRTSVQNFSLVSVIYFKIYNKYQDWQLLYKYISSTTLPFNIYNYTQCNNYLANIQQIFKNARGRCKIKLWTILSSAYKINLHKYKRSHFRKLRFTVLSILYLKGAASLNLSRIH